MDIQEKFDDLYTLKLNLELAISDVEDKVHKEDLQQILWRVEDEIKEVEEELEEFQEAQRKQEEQEREREYREMVGF